MRPWSNSRLNRWECPWRGNETDGKGRMDLPGVWAEFGREFHVEAQRLAQWMGGLRSARPAPAPQIAPVLDRLQEMLKREDLPNTFIGAETRRAINASGEPVAWDDPTVLYRGIIDLETASPDLRTYTIIDYKSGFLVQSVEDEESRLRHQLLGYLNLIHPVLPPQCERVRLVGLFPRWWARREITIELNTVEAWGATEALHTRIGAAESRVQRDGHAARAGDHCSYCHLIAECPLRNEVQASGRFPIATAQDAARAAEAYHVAVMLTGKLKDALKAWTDGHGPVAIPGLEYGEFPPEEQPYRYPTGETFKAMTDLGFPGEDVVAINKRLVEQVVTAGQGRKAEITSGGRTYHVPIDAHLDLIALRQPIEAKPVFRKRKIKAPKKPKRREITNEKLT